MKFPPLFRMAVYPNKNSLKVRLGFHLATDSMAVIGS